MSSGRFAVGAALRSLRGRHLEVAALSLGGLLQYFVFIYLWVIGVFPPIENTGGRGRGVREHRGFAHAGHAPPRESGRR